MGNPRRMALVGALVICFLLAIATQAFAAAGYTSYKNWASVSGLPGQGTSPHGGYATTTVKCAVCHSVHGADPTPAELLLRSPAAEACTYCHLDSATGYTQVYGSDINNYSGTDFNNAHNSYDVLGVEQGVTCTKCHQVHAADGQMTSNAFLTQKLLVGGKTYTGTNYDPVAQEPLSSDDTRTALSKWCAGCHFTQGGAGYSYWGEGYNGQSHVMATATATYGNTIANYSGRVAWNNSTYCSSCHASDFDAPSGEWPHFTAGDRFLVSGANSGESLPATNTETDGVCLRCHRDTGGNGIGLGF